MNVWIVLTNFNRLLTVRADTKAGALQEMARGLSIGEIVLRIQML